MVNTYILIGISLLTLIFIYLYWKGYMIEGFEAVYPANNITTKAIDAVAVLPDPLINPMKVVVVITKNEYVWKYDIISKKFNEMSIQEKEMGGLSLINGYPKSIRTEWPFLDPYFYSDLTAIGTAMYNNNNSKTPEVQWYKNRYKYVLNIRSQWKGIKMAAAVPILPNDKSVLDVNQGFDDIISFPDYIYPGSGDEKTDYINAIFPNLQMRNGTGYIQNGGYTSVYEISKDDKDYVIEILSGRNRNYTWNTNNLRLQPIGTYFSNTKLHALSMATLPFHMHNRQGFYNPKLSGAHSRLYTNDLFNCLYTVGSGVQGIENCTLWHQIKRKPRCAFTYPLKHTRQNPSYVYVFDENKVWKYKPIEKYEEIETILSLVTGYPKTISQEYPGLHQNFAYNPDGVFYHNENIYFLKGKSGTKYNPQNNNSSGIFNVDGLFRDKGDNYIEAYVQVVEGDKTGIHLYSGNKILKYTVGGYSFEKDGEWSDVPIDENMSNDRVMCGWYHPQLESKVLTFMKHTIADGETYQNVNLYHAYSKTIVLSDKIAEGHLIIQQPLIGDIKTAAFTMTSGQLNKLENDSFPYQRYWDNIIQKKIPEMCGAVHVPGLTNMRFIFAGDRHYKFVNSGAYNDVNYNMNLWGNTSNSNTREFPRNFQSESRIIPSNFDICFYDTNQIVWFLKKDKCWKFNVNAKNIESVGDASQYFQDYDPAFESAIFDWTTNKLYFIKGNTYTSYNYNINRSTKVQSDGSMFGLMEIDVARPVSKDIKIFSPTNATMSQAYGIEDVSLNINSLHNFIPNGDFADETSIDNLGEIDVSRQVVKTGPVMQGLSFNGNVLRYSMNGGLIVDLSLPELYVSDIVFSFYIKKDPGTRDFHVTVSTESDQKNEIRQQVTDQWERIQIYQWQNFDHPFKIKVDVQNNGNKTFYATGFQLENNLKALPFFSGRVFHTWDDVEPPEIAYVYNVNHLSTIPPQQNEIDISTLMGYNTLNQQRNNEDLGFEKEQAVHFDGKKVFMIIPTTSLKPTTLKQFSVSTWIRFREFSAPPNYQSIYGVKDDNNNTYLYVDEIGGKIRIRMKNNRTFSHIFETVHLDTGKWYFLALTIFDNKLRLYAYHYYEEIDINSSFLSTKINTKILIGVPPNYEEMIYKNHMLFADVGSISVWRRPLTPEDIKLLSRTFKDVKLALPEITRQQLVSTGLALPLLTMDVGAVDGLGMCTYNAHIKWKMPKLPLDYKKLGYNIVRYEAKIEYYIAGNLVAKDNLEPHIMAERITENVKDIKFRLPQIQCKECTAYVINIPYEYNYRLYIRYILGNNETSGWSEMDLRFRDQLVSKFNITSNTTCKYKVYQIDPQAKIKAEQTQNKFLDYSRRKIKTLRL